MYYINRNGGIKGALKEINYGTNNNFSYTYDAVGRIKTELKNGVLNREYEYDSMGQLTAEYLYDPAVVALYTDDTTVDRIKLYYIYNINGNLTEQGCNKEWLDESGNATTSNLSLNTYGYYGSHDTGYWLSPLMYDGNEEIAYDSMGNPLNYFGKNFTWENGRELASITSSSGASIASYEYDASGLRISKNTTSGGTVYYVYDESSNLIFEKHSDYTLAFYYDGNGIRTHFTKKSDSGFETYYYRYNLQGDIIALLNNAGTVVAEYNYTAYGKPIGTVGEIGNLNPFRYRGYYYDNETGFYYLQSRYYDPNTTRFINADAAEFVGATGTPLSFNLFLYCENDPVNSVDETGFWAEKLYNFKLIPEGFTADVNARFLSEAYCRIYAADIYYRYLFKNKGIRRMGIVRMAAEIYAHALAYYFGSIMVKFGISRGASYVKHGKQLYINYNDKWAYKYWIVWGASRYIKHSLLAIIPGYMYYLWIIM